MSWGKRASLVYYTDWSLAKEQRWPGKKRVQNSPSVPLRGQAPTEGPPQQGRVPTARSPHQPTALPSSHPLANATLPEFSRAVSSPVPLTSCSLSLSPLPNTFPSTSPLPHPLSNTAPRRGLPLLHGGAAVGLQGWALQGVPRHTWVPTGSEANASLPLASPCRLRGLGRAPEAGPSRGCARRSSLPDTSAGSRLSG